MTTFEQILDSLGTTVLLNKYSTMSSYYMAKCPACAEEVYNLLVGLDVDGNIHMHCIRGCERREILKAIGKEGLDDEIVPQGSTELLRRYKFERDRDNYIHPLDICLVASAIAELTNAIAVTEKGESE